MASLFVVYQYSGGIGNQVLSEQAAPRSKDAFNGMEERLRSMVREPSAVVINWIELPDGE